MIGAWSRAVDARASSSSRQFIPSLCAGRRRRRGVHSGSARCACAPLPLRSRCLGRGARRRGDPGRAVVRVAGARVDGRLPRPTLPVAGPERFWRDVTTLRAQRAALRRVLERDRAQPGRRSRATRPRPAYRLGRSSTGWWSTRPAHKVDVVLTLWRTPRWARADNGRGGKPNLYSWAPRLSDWRNFVYAAATRYSGKYDPDGGGLRRPAAAGAASGRCGTSRTTSARCGRSEGAASRPRRRSTRASSTPATPRSRASSASSGSKLDVLGGAMNRGFRGEGSVAPLIFLRGMKAAPARSSTSPACTRTR